MKSEPRTIHEYQPNQEKIIRTDATWMMIICKRFLGYTITSTLWIHPIRVKLAPPLLLRLHSGSREKQYMKCYQIKGVGEKSSVTAYTDTGHEIQTDLPRWMGGMNKAPQPVEILLSAFMGCTQATAIFVGKNMKPRKLNISRIDFDITAYRDERGAIGGTLPIGKDSSMPDVPSRLQRISGTIKISLKNDDKISEEEIRIIERQTEARCPVANMMRSSGCEFHVQWVGV